jgi:tripartite-type tricarboxylate transporter receptor subunit TctC
VKTVADFVQWSKANAQQDSYGSPGEGTMAHFAGVMFARAAGIQLSHVPYKGGAPAIQDLIGGQIPASINVLSEALPHAKSGKLRVLATTGATRSPFLPEAPTLKEAGFKDFEVEEYFGMFVPSKTPPEIVEKLAAAIREALKAPDVQERLAQLAFQPAGTTPANFAEIVKADLEKWGPIVKSTGFSLTD